MFFDMRRKTEWPHSRKRANPLSQAQITQLFRINSEKSLALTLLIVIYFLKNFFKKYLLKKLPHRDYTLPNPRFGAWKTAKT